MKTFAHVPQLPDPEPEQPDVRPLGYVIAVLSNTDIRRVREGSEPKNSLYVFKSADDLVQSKMSVQGMDKALSDGLGAAGQASTTREEAASRLWNYLCETAVDFASIKLEDLFVTNKMGSMKRNAAVTSEDFIRRSSMSSRTQQMAFARLGVNPKSLVEVTPQEWTPRGDVEEALSVLLAERGMQCTGRQVFAAYFRRMIGLGLIEVKRDG